MGRNLVWQSNEFNQYSSRKCYHYVLGLKCTQGHIWPHWEMAEPLGSGAWRKELRVLWVSLEAYRVILAAPSQSPFCFLVSLR